MLLYMDLPAPRTYLKDDRSNALTPLEIQLQQELIALGRQDMADAVAGGRRYHRLEDVMFGWTSSFEAAVGLRLAFKPDAKVPDSKEEWIKEAMLKYAHDKELQAVATEWEVEKVRRALEKAKLEVEVEKLDAEKTTSEAAEVSPEKEAVTDATA